MLTRARRRLRTSTAVGLVLLFVGLLAALPGDISPATAQPAPSVDEFVAEMDAMPGFFNAYQTDDGRLYMEVTDDHFDQDFLIVMQMARGVGESFLLTGYPLGSAMMTFRMRNEQIELVARNPRFRADAGTPLERMVELGFRESVYSSFGIAAKDDDAGRYLIDVTGLFLSDVPGLVDVLPQIYGVGFRPDPSRSVISSVKGFPENVEIKADLTFAASGPIPSVTTPDPKALPIAYHYSILKLPEEPMKPRLADDRIGYFSTTYKDYSRQGGPTNSVRLVNRWRLEKQDPYAELSEPVKPIVFYLENTIPEAYRPFIREGVEAWNKAFEVAGFKNAIVALDQPDDPNWDPGDARYSTIRWMPSVSSIFAIGPSDVDPRSGEILNADILFTADWVRALTGEYAEHVDSPWQLLSQERQARELAELLNPDDVSKLCTYGVGAAPHNALLRHTLLADGVMSADGDVPLAYVGAALRETTMHEIGHTLGLRHNFKASSAVPNDKLHDVEFTQEHGITASIMEYNPANINPDRENQGEYYNSTVGPYDLWAIQWGYLPVGNETLQPHPELEAIAEQRHRPEHAFGTDEDGWLYPYSLDPRIVQWDLGADPIAFYHDLQRLIDRLWDGLDDRLLRDGDAYWPLRSSLHFLLFEEFQGYFYGIKGIGGLSVTRAHKGDPNGDVPLTVLPAGEQRRTLEFILEAFEPDALREFPKELLDKAITERWWDWASSWTDGMRFTYPIHDTLTAGRSVILNMAFESERLMRIRDNAYRADEPDPFTLDELFLGFTDTIWADVLGGQAPTDSFQRQIQAVYVEKLIGMSGMVAENGSAGGDTPSGNPIGVAGNPNTIAPRVDDAEALAFTELIRIKDAVDGLLGSGSLDALSRAHLTRTSHRIATALQL